MRLRTLGTLALDETSFRRHKPLLLLTYLTLEGPQERGYLARLFWPEAPQSSQRLRAALELLRSGAPGAAERVGSKVMSPLRCDAVDLVVTFEDGNLENCVVLYEGAFLEGLAAGRLGLELEEWVFATRERLAEYARRALLRLAERIRADPKRSAHYAKQAYLLVGAGEPSREQLARVLRALRAADDPLAATIEREADDISPSLDMSLDPNGTEGEITESATPRHNLTTPPTALLGRGALLIDLEGRLASPDIRLLTLTGMGGVGKTRLAVELTWRLLPLYDAVYFVPLAASHDPDEVLGAVARALELEPVAGRPLQDALVAELQGQYVLLVLDNFEQVLAAATEVADLLARCRRLKVIITSRSALRLRGEHEVVVPPLATPPAAEGLPNEISVRAYASVVLFCARAAEVRGGEEFGEGELATIGDLCRRVDGLPLAIELAASRTKLLSPAEILERLDQSLDLLAQGARDLPERHRSLRGTLAWSYNLLTHDEKQLFRRLGVAPGGCGLTLATALWHDATTNPETAGDEGNQVLDLLSSLLDKSLVIRYVGSEGELRVTMLETVRRFAAETLASDPVELHASLERMFGYVRTLVVDFRGPVESADPDAMARVSQELGNIRAAWLWAVAQGHTAHVLQASMFDFFANAGRHLEGISLFTNVVHLLEKHDDAEASGRIYGSLAWFYYMTGDIAGARDAAGKSVTALRKLNQPEVLGVALETHAGILYGKGDYPGARDAYEEAYSLYQKTKSQEAHVTVLHALGLVASAEGDYPKALEFFGQALFMSQNQELTWSSAETLARISQVHRLTGNLPSSVQAAEEGYGLSRKASATYSQTLAAYELGLSVLALGDIGRAETLLNEALQAALTGTSPEFIARAHLGLARTAATRRATSSVTEHLLGALLAVKDTGLRPVVLSCLLTVAELASFVGLDGQAVALLYPVRNDPAARAHERHRAAALIGEMDADAQAPTETLSSLPLLIKRVVERLARERADGPWLKGDL